MLQASRKKQMLVWKGQRFFTRQDVATEVQKQRAAYKDIIEKMKTTSLQFDLLHPARFIITTEGETLRYDSAEAAWRGLKERVPNIF